MLNALHDLKDETMLKVLSLTAYLMVGTLQMTFAQRSLPQEPKSTATAIKYSAYGTAIPIVVGGAISLAASEDDITALVIGIHVGALGAVAGPGLGHAYTGRWGHFAIGSLVRTVGAIFIASGIIELAGGPDFGSFNESSSEDRSGAPALILGGAIYLWSAIHDFRTLDRSVKKYNQKHTGATISVSPTYYASENAPGIVVCVSF